MQFSDRFNSYQVSNPIEPTQIKLIYRGETLYYTPRSVVVSEFEIDAPTVALIYRGNTYERKLSTPKPYQKPRAINWRWQHS